VNSLFKITRSEFSFATSQAVSIATPHLAALRALASAMFSPLTRGTPPPYLIPSTNKSLSSSVALAITLTCLAQFWKILISWKVTSFVDGLIV